MKQARTLLLAMAIGLVCVAIPLAGMALISWSLAIHEEEQRLSRQAELIAKKTDRKVKSISDVLLTAGQTGLEPCSTAHIAEMRRLTINSRSVEEIGYFDNRLLTCTSWGETEGNIAQAESEIMTPGGLEINPHVKPKVTLGNTMIAVQLGPYNALVDPQRFVDMVFDTGISVAVADVKGIILSGSKDLPAELVARLVADPTTPIDDNHLLAIAQSDNWVAVVTQNKGVLWAGFQRKLMFMLPLGVLLAAIFVALLLLLFRRRMSPLGELASAVRNREFILNYQPIVSLQTGACIGAEALVRWRRADGSIVPPDHFIPLAEESGLIVAITDQVIESVVDELADTLAANRDLHIAINLSAADIRGGRVLSILEQLLQEAGIKSEQIWLEATERGFIDIDRAREFMTQARERGYAIAIDDFGTGYSSLQYLESLPLDAIKIDRSFVETIGSHRTDSSITPHIIRMAQMLGLAIVAEGIETEIQSAWLKAKNVEYGQGWLYSKPLPADSFLEFLKQNSESKTTGHLAETA